MQTAEQPPSSELSVIFRAQMASVTRVPEVTVEKRFSSDGPAWRPSRGAANSSILAGPKGVSGRAATGRPDIRKLKVEVKTAVASGGVDKSMRVHGRPVHDGCCAASHPQYSIPRHHQPRSPARHRLSCFH